MRMTSKDPFAINEQSATQTPKKVYVYPLTQQTWTHQLTKENVTFFVTSHKKLQLGCGLHSSVPAF